MSDLTLSGVTCPSCGTTAITSNFCPGCGGDVHASSAPPGSAPGPSFVPPTVAPPIFAPPSPAPKNRWIKVLLIIGACFLVLIAGCAALIGTAANEVGKVGQELAEETNGDVSDKSEIKGSASVNEPLTLKGTSYTVTSVRTADSIGEQFTKVKANGKFILVKVELTNRKKQPATIMANSLTLVGGNNSAYSVSDDALLAVDDQFLLEEIQPGLSESGTLVYDLPESAIAGAELQVEDLFSDDKGRIKLGL